MTAELLVEFQKAARIESARRIVKLVFKVLGYLRRSRRKDKIKSTVFSDTLTGAKEEHLILDDWTTQREAVVPALQEGRFVGVRIERIRGIEHVVAEEY